MLLPALIGFAYGVLPRNVLDAPHWAVTPEPFDQPANAFQIEAVAGNPATATLEDLRSMVRAMLAGRFKLEIHHETQDSPGYALVIAKNGPKLKLKDPSVPEESPGLDLKCYLKNAGLS